jgi:hypothetical protein
MIGSGTHLRIMYPLKERAQRLFYVPVYGLLRIGAVGALLPRWDAGEQLDAGQAWGGSSRDTRRSSPCSAYSLSDWRTICSYACGEMKCR